MMFFVQEGGRGGGDVALGGGAGTESTHHCAVILTVVGLHKCASELPRARLSVPAPLSCRTFFLSNRWPCTHLASALASAPASAEA